MTEPRFSPATDDPETEGEDSPVTGAIGTAQARKRQRKSDEARGTASSGELDDDNDDGGDDFPETNTRKERDPLTAEIGGGSIGTP